MAKIPISDRADMIILLRDDTLEFAASGKSLGKVKHTHAAGIYKQIKLADETNRPRLINNAYRRLFNLAPAGEFVRRVANG